MYGKYLGMHLICWFVDFLFFIYLCVPCHSFVISPTRSAIVSWTIYGQFRIRSLQFSSQFSRIICFVSRRMAECLFGNFVSFPLVWRSFVPCSGFGRFFFLLQAASSPNISFGWNYQKIPKISVLCSSRNVERGPIEKLVVNWWSAVPLESYVRILRYASFLLNNGSLNWSVPNSMSHCEKFGSILRSRIYSPHFRVCVAVDIFAYVWRLTHTVCSVYKYTQPKQTVWNSIWLGEGLDCSVDTPHMWALVFYLRFTSQHLSLTEVNWKDGFLSDACATTIYTNFAHYAAARTLNTMNETATENPEPLKCLCVFPLFFFR